MTTKNITLIAILSAILVVAQLSFSMVMGLNLVFPLLIIYTYNLGFEKGLIIMGVSTFIGFLIWGFPLTSLLWAWTFSILILGAYLLSKVSKNEYVAGVYTFIFFISFGLFASFQEWALTGVEFYWYWMNGLPSDLLGAVAGFGTTVVLLNPISSVIKNYLATKTKSLSE